MRLAFVGCWPIACTTGFMAFRMRSCSSEAYRLGTSPEFKMLLMSSRKDSLLICGVNPKVMNLLTSHSAQDTSYKFRHIWKVKDYSATLLRRPTYESSDKACTSRGLLFFTDKQVISVLRASVEWTQCDGQRHKLYRTLTGKKKHISLFTCVSTKRNVICLSLRPAFSMMLLMSSLHSVWP